VFAYACMQMISLMTPKVWISSFET